MQNEGNFTGLNGTNLFYQLLKPVGNPKAVALVVHGHGDHSGGLQNMYKSLLQNQYIVYAFDLRGHGQSSGVRGFISNWKEYREDLHTFRELVTSENPDLPLFIIGHSLGGLIGIDYALHYGKGLAGLVTIAPAISYEVKTLEKILITIFSRIKPDYTLVKKSRPHLLTQDQEVITKINADKLRHNTVTPGLGRALMKILPELMSKASSISLPFLLQYGLEDKVTPPTKLHEFFRLVGSGDKQELAYEKLRHRPFDDIGREAFLADLNNWLDQLN
ncbi:alpha-beta hydrolase superfamily lysophospholipase [Salirhabdus euzebyi]|uniref:Alpha-beta hydrolase superfamily lysophospholipase n=1 Tax=Salirhabdus euzebyi TaxID=394506 RepID=A0A841Q5J3_9BACI|nr:alpha/beta hydrolase [Salirhabdus euzebyi]MBB6453739.1 alpha-beta hydrolase superfamily lysophospholipase [Salirhabdus euzebyi]